MDYMLKPEDFVGVTFWIISVSMVASTAFFFLEAQSVSKHWQTSVRVAGLVTLIAAVHYSPHKSYCLTLATRYVLRLVAANYLLSNTYVYLPLTSHHCC